MPGSFVVILTILIIYHFSTKYTGFQRLEIPFEDLLFTIIMMSVILGSTVKRREDGYVVGT